MAAAEVPVPSGHFTQIKEQKLMPGDLEEEKEEDGLQRVEAQEGAVEEAEAEDSSLLLDARSQELPPRALVESDRRILTLQTVHLASQDVHLQGLGWLSVPHSEELPGTVPQAESILQLPSVLWFDPEPQLSLEHCVTVSIPEDLYPPEELELMGFHQLELMGFHLLQENLPVAEEDQELTPDLDESAAPKKPEEDEKDQPLPQGGTDKKEERFLFVEMKPNEGKDEIVLTISRLSLEEQQDPPAVKQTREPKVKAAKAKPRRQTKGKPQTFQCDTCPFTSSKLSTYNRHIKIHSDERPHLCHLCLKAFRTVTLLRNHVNTHTGKAPRVAFRHRP